MEGDLVKRLVEVEEKLLASRFMITALSAIVGALSLRMGVAPETVSEFIRKAAPGGDPEGAAEVAAKIKDQLV